MADTFFVDDSVFEHPEDDLLELYVLRKLGAPDLWSIEEHLMVCPKCRERLKATKEFVVAIRAAAMRLDDSTPRKRPTRHLHTVRLYLPTPRGR